MALQRISVRFQRRHPAVTSPRTPIVIEDVLKDPTRHFSHPNEVLHDARLNREQKLRILRSWALDAELIDDAESENMRGRPGVVSQLRAARLALLELAG